MIPKCRLACLFRFLMVFRRRRERKNFISKICKIWEQTNCWIVFGCIIHIWCTPQAPQILSKFLHKTVKIYLLSDIYRGVTLRCCGVHGYYLDFFISDLWNTRPLLLWFYTKHFHTALKYLPFFLKKRKKETKTTTCIQNLSSCRFSWLGSDDRKKRNNRVWWSHFFLQPVCHCSQHLFISLFSRRRSVLFTFTPERRILISRWRLQRPSEWWIFLFFRPSCVY